MKNKNIAITRLINSILITLVLMYLFHKTPNGKIILIPFLVCSIATIGKNIFIIMEKNKYVNLFNNLFISSFLLFWFGFLMFWCYLAIKQNSYQLILFSIPFWLVGIYVIRKKLFKKQKNKIKSEKSKFNPKILIGSSLVGITLVIGIIMLIFGIKDTYKLNKDTRDYVTVKGYYYNYDIYSSDSDGTTYQLIYKYEVDNKEYYINTNYGTSYIPDINSIREVKYNPSNPEEAILVGTNNKNLLIYIGAFFTLGSMTFILVGITVMGYFDKFKIDVMGTYLGIMFLIIGIGIILLQNGTTMSLVETIKSFSIWIFIPIMFIIVGIYQTIRCLFITRKR